MVVELDELPAEARQRIDSFALFAGTLGGFKNYPVYMGIYKESLLKTSSISMESIKNYPIMW